MARLLKTTRRKIKTQKSVPDTNKKSPSVVLVGTYKRNQLAFIEREGVYNYPIGEDDKFRPEVASCVKELWLYADRTKATRHVFEASFVGIQTRDEFLAANPKYPKGGKSKHTRYLVFTAKKLEYGSAIDDATRVFARASDFNSGKTRKIAAAIKQFEEGGEFGLIADFFPEDLANVPRNQLRVCESAVQMDFFAMFFQIERKSCAVPEEIKDGRLSLIDLFSGCGGMSLGFELAGFNSVLAIERDAWASETYAYNHPDVKVVTGDITKILKPKEDFSSIGNVFGIIGGPPCQGFSLSGDRDPKDPRNSLFMDYMRFVKDFKPKFFVMENVVGILSAVTKKGEPVKDVVVSVAKEIGYNVKVMQLDASHYGVPQARQRVFFIGIRDDYTFIPERLVPKRNTESNPVTIWQALSDLPQIQACEGEETMEYPKPPETDYQKWCRIGSSHVSNHVAMRHTKRLVARFHIIKFGESAADVPQEHMQRKRGDASVISGKVYSQNNMRPYPDRPSPTVPASFQSNFVHPYIDRNYTAREGARLQSFPDRYIFKGHRTTMSWEKNLSQYQQIGNAVPPLLAKALGEMIINYFKQITE